MQLPRSTLMIGLVAVAGIAALTIMQRPALHVESEAIGENGAIAEPYALCKATETSKSGRGENIRPTISWSDAPKETKSFALVISDPDVPADFTDAGKEGKTIPANAPRQIFYHWALADIPADIVSIPGGNARKAPGFGAAALSDLGSYVPNAKNYGGPCPPWNDERVHHYHFTIYALDVPTLGLPPNATAKDMAAAVADHTLASGKIIGTYTLNPALRK